VSELPAGVRKSVPKSDLAAVQHAARLNPRPVMIAPCSMGYYPIPGSSCAGYRSPSPMTTVPLLMSRQPPSC
jgi:hypothetical protein